MILLPTQIHAKDVVEWLMSDDWKNRASGRSHLMATIFIERAIQNPGVWINVWDHGPYHPKKEEWMLRMISNIVQEQFKEWKFKANHVNKAFSLEKK